jgi:hypothetical protein
MRLVKLFLESSPLASVLLNLFENEKKDEIGFCPFPTNLSFCQGGALANLPQCQLGTAESENLKSYFILERLLREPFFRYFKVDLRKKCPYWDSAMICFSDQCAIDVLPEEPEFIPKFQPLLRGEMDSLNDVKFPKFQQVCFIFEIYGVLFF